MQRRIIGFTVLLLVVAMHSAVHATEGTCTITHATSANNLNLTFAIPVVNGLVMPVSFDEASGTFSMSRDAWSSQFGANGATFATGFGPDGFLILGPGTVTGTIDAGGNVVLPDFALAFATDFCPPRSPDYPLSPNLTTEAQFLEVTGQTFSTTGVPLDFSTGSLTLEGQDVIPSACGAPGALLSGLRLTCTLSPIPNQASLPPAPTLAATGGKAIIGKPLPTTPPTKPVKGDVLTLKTKLEGWVAPPVDFGRDVHVNLATGDGTVVLLHVPAGKLQTKGKKAFVKDTDGTSIVVVTGHEANDTVSAAFGGTVTFISGKKGIVLKVRVLGLDLQGVTGPLTLAVAVGPRSATVAVNANGTGKVRKIK